MNIENLLHKEIESEFADLAAMEVGTESHRATIDGLTKLVDRAIEIEKFNSECDDKVTNREIENELKRKQLRDERIDRITTNCLTGVSIVGGFALTIWGAKKSWKFEEEGTITSTMGRGFMNRLLPRK